MSEQAETDARSGSPAIIRVSAVCLLDERGLLLTVRKRGTSVFMLPGGKPEPGEDARATALREILEELGLALDPEALLPLGEWSARAANEAGTTVVGSVFRYGPAIDSASAAAAAEIEELRWVALDSPDRDDEARLTRERAMPALRAALGR